MASLVFVYFAISIGMNAAAVTGKEIFQLIENNNFASQPYKTVGSWSSWLTGFHVNEQHDGYLDIGTVTFNAAKLNLTYTASTNCTNEYPLFANGRIFCVSNMGTTDPQKMLFSYYPQNGSISFSYLYVANDGYGVLLNPTFSMHNLNSNDSSLFIHAYPGSANKELYIYSFDAISGKQESSSTVTQFTAYKTRQAYAVGTPYDEVYLNIQVNGSASCSVSAYNMETYDFTKSASNLLSQTQVPSICDNKVFVTAASNTYSPYTTAYDTAPYFNELWTFGDGNTKGESDVVPVCLFTRNGYRVIVKTSASKDKNNTCYVLNTLNGEKVEQFQCVTLPIFHYKRNGFADIAIMGTEWEDGRIIHVSAVKMKGDKIDKKELWNGGGNIDYSFIVNDYFVTGYRRIENWTVYNLDVKIYNIFNGDIMWERSYRFNPYYSYPYAVFGGLYDNEGKDEFMLIVRIENTFYAYTQLIDDHR